MQRKEAVEDINVLVCLSASPSNQKVIKSAAKFARGNQRPFTALYVDDGRLRGDRIFLHKNAELVRNLGGSVEFIQSTDVIAAITRYALDMAVTDLFIGFSGPGRSTSARHLLAYKLVQALPAADVHIIPDAFVELKPSRLGMKKSGRFNPRDLLLMSGIMTAATGLCVLVDISRFSNSNIVTIYILAVLLTAVMTAERIYGIIAAVLYILLFNFLFINPRFSFLVYDPDYMVTYLVSFVAAIITGNISSRMKEMTLQSGMNAYQAQILLDASEALQQAQGTEEITRITVSRLHELLGRDILYYDRPRQENTPAMVLVENSREMLTGASAMETVSPAYMKAILWTMQHNQRTGYGTRHFPELDCQFLAVRTGGEIYGVIGARVVPSPLDQFEESILLSLISECALSLENEKNRKEREAAQIIAENERFRSKLLRSVSHDLRTPLTSISGNAANLRTHEDRFTPEERRAIYDDLYQDAVWLIDLVENLLAITKLEERVAIHPTGEVVADVLTGAVEKARRHGDGHKIILEPDNSCLVAEMDAALIMQVLDNLIANAIKHTPAGTTVRIRDWLQDDHVMISVADDGPGIAKEDQPHIFDLFYTGGKRDADAGRSLGLGLNLCRSILEAHGQTIEVTDNVPHGAVFVFSLRLWKENDGRTSDERVSDPGR